MRSATPVTMLMSLTTAMAVAAPFVVFGFLYVLLVQPERAGAGIARNELDLALAHMDRQRSSMRAPSAGIEGVAAGEFVLHAARVERPSDLVDALTDLLNGPAVGGVSNLLVGTGVSASGRTPVTVAFDARLEQIVRFFRTLRALPSHVDLQTVEIEAVSPWTGLARANVSLLVSAAPGQPVAAAVSTGAVAAPERAREVLRIPPPAAAPLPAPVVSSILISDGRRFARVDGRIVGPGDRLPAGLVQSIESDAVVLAGPDGRSRRVEIVRPEIGARTP